MKKPENAEKFSFSLIYLRNNFANIEKAYKFVVLSKRE